MRFEVVQSPAQWDQAKAIRQVVFVEEQACPPEEEWDAFDATSRHLLGYDGDVAVAVSRWRAVQLAQGAAAKLERFAVLQQARGRGAGRELVGYTLDDARRAGHRRFYLHAQAHLAAFYGSFGFAVFGEPFDEVGIPHVHMLLELP